MVEVNINLSKLEKAARQAFRETCMIAHRNMIKVISEPGAFPDFPNRDIVDTGNLRANQQPPEFQGDFAYFRNTAEYSAYIYLGYTRLNGVSVKGRPWMMTGVERTDIEKTFAALLKAKL